MTVPDQSPKQPVLCLAINWVAYALTHVSAVISCMGIASEYLVKCSIKIRRYLFFLGVSGYGPQIFMEVISKG